MRRVLQRLVILLKWLKPPSFGRHSEFTCKLLGRSTFKAQLRHMYTEEQYKVTPQEPSKDTIPGHLAIFTRFISGQTVGQPQSSISGASRTSRRGSVIRLVSLSNPQVTYKVLHNVQLAIHDLFMIDVLLPGFSLLNYRRYQISKHRNLIFIEHTTRRYQPIQQFSYSNHALGALVSMPV